MARKRTMQTQVFDRLGRKHFATPIENVAAERDFNRVEIEGVAPDAFENAMAGVESDLSRGIERIRASGAFHTADDRACLLNLIGLLHLRNPRHRETFRDFHERVAKRIMDLVVATPERWAGQVAKATKEGFLSPDADTNYEKMKAFVREGEFSVETPTEQHITLEMETFDKILPYLFGRGWMLGKASEKSGGFVTSDHPVCLIWSDPPTGRAFARSGWGFGEPKLCFRSPRGSRQSVRLSYKAATLMPMKRWLPQSMGRSSPLRSGRCARFELPLSTSGGRASPKSVAANLRPQLSSPGCPRIRRQSRLLGGLDEQHFPSSCPMINREAKM